MDIITKVRDIPTGENCEHPDEGQCRFVTHEDDDRTTCNLYGAEVWVRRFSDEPKKCKECEKNCAAWSWLM